MLFWVLKREFSLIERVLLSTYNNKENDNNVLLFYLPSNGQNIKILIHTFVRLYIICVQTVKTLTRLRQDRLAWSLVATHKM